ncbi:hypothetical protein GQ473_01795 [archaeon]|nr:hypothetical protein [archaeon]
MEGTGTADIGAIDSASAYQQSFGILKDRTTYMNGWQTDTEGKYFDYRTNLKDTMNAGIKSIQVKALGPTAGGAGTAGYALVPIYVDPRIVDTSRKQTPLVEMIPRVTNLGLTADYNTVTAKGAAYTANSDAALPEADDTEDRSSVGIKYLYSVGRVLGPMQAGMPSYMMEGFQPNGGAVTSFSPIGAPNAKQFEVLKKAKSMKELEENLILNGDASTDATQFSGIVKLQGTTNQLDKDSAALSYSDVETSVQSAYDDGGMPKLAVCSSSVLTDLRAIMLDQFRFTPAEMAAGNTLPFGIPTTLVLQTMVGPIPVIPSRFLSNTSGSKQIFFLDTDFIEMRVLQDMTYEDLAKINDSNKFMLKIYEALIMRATQFNSFIDNIA